MHSRVLRLYPNNPFNASANVDRLHSPPRGAQVNFRSPFGRGDARQVQHTNFEIGMSLKQFIADSQDLKVNRATEIDFAQLVHDLEVKEQPPAEEVLLPINNTPSGTAGNYGLLSGKKKSRKTLLLVLLASWCKHQLMIFDTEQGKQHVWKVKEKIKTLTGNDVPIFFLRGLNYLERRQLIEQALKQHQQKPRVVFIDGVRDLLADINNEAQTFELVTWLEKLTIEHNIFILLVLHLNKTDGNLRGHLGTELGNKSQVVIEVKLDEVAGVSVATCESSRDIPFQEFAFTHNHLGLPEVVNTPTAGKVLPDEERRARLSFMFNEASGLLKYDELVTEVKEHFEVGTNKAKSMVKEFNRLGWLVKTGADRTKNVVYKCMI